MKAFLNLTLGHIPTFVVDAWFLRDCIRHHTPLEDEVGSYITGPQLGGVRILSRICPVEPHVQSPVRFIGSARSCASRLIEIIENGNRLHATFHSHPGAGVGATCPSFIDDRYMEKLQRRGAKALGLICTRDGYVRAYSPAMPFMLLVQGTMVDEVEGADHVFKIQM